MYHLRVNGPNGFYREYRHNAKDLGLSLECDYKCEPNAQIKLNGKSRFTVGTLEPGRPFSSEIKNHAYSKKMTQKLIGASAGARSPNSDCP